MFVGRKNELNQLEELYSRDSFQFVVVYGRRRVGKTSLINRFIQNKDAIFYTGIESNEKQNLENFSKSIYTYLNMTILNAIFQDFYSALEYIFELSLKQKLILVIDEYPYLAKASPSFASILQALIDKYKDTSKLFLILCGSSMSFMENHVLGYKAPLYGRRTAQFKILPFDFFELRDYFHGFSNQDLVAIYGMVGGTPQYLLQMNDKLSIEENIKNTFLNITHPLFEEPNNLLKQEVREQAKYNSIISIVANGATRLNEIADKAGEETSSCSVYLNNLISLGIIKKETPFQENTARKTIYVIDDNMFRFWYRFIPENMSFITRGLSEIAYEHIEKQLPTYLGATFEEICKQYLWKIRKDNECLVSFTDIGRWWGNDPINKCEAEIDIMGSDDKGNLLLCECKWKNEKIDVSVLNALLEKGNIFQNRNIYYYLFSKSGFTKKCIMAANEMDNIRLVKYDDMFD